MKKSQGTADDKDKEEMSQKTKFSKWLRSEDDTEPTHREVDITLVEYCTLTYTKRYII